MRSIGLILLTSLLAACDGCEEDPRGPGVRRTDASTSDSGTTDGDTGAVLDTGFVVDAGIEDAGAADAGDEDSGLSDLGIEDSGDEDSGAEDSGAEDSGAIADTGVDAGTPDSGAEDSGAIADTGVVDAGTPDSGAEDSGAIADTGVVDAGTPDSGIAPDTGIGTGGLWIEIDYTSAYSPQSPDWSYSQSPGWTPNDWSFTGGGSGAEAWDRWNNMSVVSDPIGTVLEIGPGSELQLMLGIVRMTSYTTATVELEGRSRATSSPVHFDVTNPALGLCGGSASMSQDWNPDIVIVDLTGCFTPGSALQAVRVDPTSGTIALRRMKLTFTDATW